MAQNHVDFALAQTRIEPDGPGPYDTAGEQCLNHLRAIFPDYRDAISTPYALSDQPLAGLLYVLPHLSIAQCGSRLFIQEDSVGLLRRLELQELMNACERGR
ncbi:hypothetical protein GCM10027288_24720 [Bordetella tumbae]